MTNRAIGLLAGLVLTPAAWTATVPDWWYPQKICGRDYNVCFYAAGQNTRSPVYGGAVKTFDLDIFREGGIEYDLFVRVGIAGRLNDANRSRYANPATAAESRQEYGIADFFSPSVRQALDEFPDPQKPLFFQVHASRPPMLIAEGVKPDVAGWRAWRATHPGFVGFGVCQEVDTEMNWYLRYAKNTPDAALRESLLRRFPVPTTRYEWLDTVKKAFDTEVNFLFGETNAWTLSSSCYTLAHIMANNGARGLFYEATGQEYARWQIAGAYLRGAARQWRLPYGWYAAHFFSGYRRDDLEKLICGDNSFTGHKYSWTNGGFRKPWRGLGRTMLDRQNFYGWIIGSSVMQVEDWQSLYMAFGPDDKTRVPSEPAQDLEALYHLSKTTERGACYTPCAILAPISEQYGPSGTRLWYFPNIEDYYSLDAFFLTLNPVNSDIFQRELRKKGDQSCLFNSPFGEFYDVLAPDSHQPSDEFSAALAPYDCAFLVGEYRKADLNVAALDRYVRNGGRLYVSADRVLDGLVSAELTGVGFTGETVSSGESLVADGQKTRLGDEYKWYLPKSGVMAAPFLKDELGNVVAWRQEVGKGEVVTVAARRFTPVRYHGITADDKQWEKRSDYFTGRHRFEVIRHLLDAEMRRTLPYRVEGDVQWGVNKVRSKSAEGRSEREEQWLVWLVNNKGVTHFVDEPEAYDAAKTATVRIVDRAGKVVRTVSVAPGKWRLESAGF